MEEDVKGVADDCSGMMKVSKKDEHEGKGGEGGICGVLWILGAGLHLADVFCPRLYTVGGSETEYDSIILVDLWKRMLREF